MNTLKHWYWDLMRRLRPTPRSQQPQAIFAAVYREGVWGDGEDFNSGTGSRDETVVKPYVAAVKEFLSTLGPEINVVDIGCGDFNVGRQLVDSAASYVACDIVPELIERNRSRYAAPQLRFKVVNAIDDELPSGDVVFIRQVFQHLSNEDISAILPKLRKFKHWIVTEHIPAERHFLPNVNKPTGGEIRIRHSNSGVILTKAPFNIAPGSESLLCEVSSPSGGRDALVRTVAYSF